MSGKNCSGLDIALIEAMALDCPALVTDVGRLTEVVEHGKHGLVVRKAADFDFPNRRTPDGRGLRGAARMKEVTNQLDMAVRQRREEDISAVLELLEVF